MLACDSKTAPGNFLLQNQFEQAFKAPARGCRDPTFVYTLPAPNQVRCADTRWGTDTLIWNKNGLTGRI